MKRKNNEMSTFKNRKAATASPDAASESNLQLQKFPTDETTLPPDQTEPHLPIESENTLPENRDEPGAASPSLLTEQPDLELGTGEKNAPGLAEQSPVMESEQPVDPESQPTILETPPDTAIFPQLSLIRSIDSRENTGDSDNLVHISQIGMDRSQQYQAEHFEVAQPGDSLNGYPVHPPASDGTFPDVEEELARLNAASPLDEAPLLELRDPVPAEPAEPSEVPSLNAAAERQNIDEVVNAILQRPYTACRVPLDLIDFYAGNRKLFNKQALEELAANIGLVDVINDVILRIMPDGRYQMVSGERRGRASRTAGKTDIPAKIYEMTDAEARMVRISENGHREDYHPMEEALNIGEMKQEFPTPELIGAQLGKPPAYIRGRIKLLSLVPEAQEIFLADSIKIKDAQDLAAFEGDVQEDFIKTHLSDWKKGKKFPDLKYSLDRLKSSLKNPPFDMKDPDLNPEMGICALCDKNSGCQQSLFVDLATDPVCLNPSCYQLKTERQLVKNVTHAVAKQKPMAIVSNMPLSDRQKTLIKEIAGTEGLEFVLENEVFEVKKPHQPKQDQFKGNGNKPNKTAFLEASRDYKEAITYLETAIRNRKVFRSILIQRNGKVDAYMFTRDSKASPNGQSGKVGLIQEDIKTGSVTTKQLMDELLRIRTNERQASLKDAAEVSESIHSEVSSRLEAKGAPVPHTAIDTAIQRWILFERLGYTDQEEQGEKLFGKDWEKLSPDAFIKILLDLTEDQMSNISRLVFLSISETKKPANSGSYLTQLLAEAIGVDVAKIQKEKALKTEERQKKFKKTETDLQKRINKKSKKNTGKTAEKAEKPEPVEIHD